MELKKVFGLLVLLGVSASYVWAETDCTPSSCSKGDIVIIIDSSGSIRAANPADGSYDNWALMLDFVAGLVDGMTIGENDVRVGVVTYSTEAKSEFYLNSHYDSAELIASIKAIEYQAGFTNTSGGIREMHNVQFTAANGDRADVPNMAIVITDGESNKDVDRLFSDADAAQAAGIKMYGIGVSSGVNTDELAGITSSPQEENKNWWAIPDFTAMAGVLSGIQRTVCNIILVPEDMDFGMEGTTGLMRVFFANLTAPCTGKITRIKLFSQGVGGFYLDVWQKLVSGKYKLQSKNWLSAGQTGELSKPIATPIPIHKNQVIGFHYHSSSATPIITYVADIGGARYRDWEYNADLPNDAIRPETGEEKYTRNGIALFQYTLVPI